MSTSVIPLCETFAFRPTGKPQLVERAGQSAMRVAGVFQNYVDKNQNGRVYPKTIWERLFNPENPFAKRLRERAMLGMIEHPEDGMTRMDQVSHVVVEARFATPIEIAESGGELKDGDILGAYEVLEGTPQGRVLKALIEARVKFGVSSRGNGTVTERADGVCEVNEDYDCETWDVVFSPSVSRALPRLVQEARDGGDNLHNMVEAGKRSDWTILTEGDAPKASEVGGNGEGKGTKHGGTALKNKKVKAVKEDVYEVRIERDGSEEPIYEGNSEQRAHGIFASWKLGNTVPVTLWHNGCPIKEHTPTTKMEEAGKPVQSKPNTTAQMNKLQEMKRKQAEVIRLTQTETAKLKPSEKSALFDSVDQLRRDIQELRNEDTALAPLAETLDKKLIRFVEEMDDEFEDDAPEAGPPAAPAGPPAPEAAPEAEGEMGGTPEEVRATLSNAAEMLRGGVDDPEAAAAAADELDSLADRCCPPEEGEGEFGDEDMAYDDMPVESARRVKKIIRENARLRTNVRRLGLASARLLEAHKRIKSSLPEGEAPNGNRKHSYAEVMEAAKDLAEKYNKDMVSMGIRLMREKDPSLYESLKGKLAAVRTWKQLGEMVQAAKAKATPSAPARRPAPRRAGTVAERFTPDKSKPKAAPLTEEVHPAVRMRQNAQRPV